MNTLIDYLGQLELSDMQAKLYLKLLETGPISVSNLAKARGINRSNTYLYLEPLFAKGLVVKIVNKSKKQIAAADPELLETLIDQKLASTQALKEQFPGLLQEIRQTFPGFTEVANVEIKSFKGVTNAQKIYEESFRANEVRAYARIDPTERLWPDNASVFEKAFTTNTNLFWKEFIYGADSALNVSEQIISSTDRYRYRYMPKYLKLSSEDILIYDGKVAIINYRGGGTSVVLESPDFYNNFKELFDFMWNLLSEVNVKHLERK